MADPNRRYHSNKSRSGVNSNGTVKFPDRKNLLFGATRAVLSQGGPRDAAVNFDKKNYNGIARFLCHSTAFL